jgi:hypothetical protein
MTTFSSDRDRFAQALGRVQQHDPASRDYPAPRLAEIPQAPPVLRDVTHPHHGVDSNQRNAGACTAATCDDYSMTHPHWRSRDPWNDERMFKLYELITRLDDFPGEWRFLRILDDFHVEGSGEDTGSSSIGMWRALKSLGQYDRVEWAFGGQHGREAMLRAPLCVGIPWRSAMFDPTGDGQVRYTGDVVGGHEIMFARMRVSQRRMWFLNHWRNQDDTLWGIRGWAWMSFADYDQAISEGGDQAQFLRTAAWKPPTV